MYKHPFLSLLVGKNKMRVGRGGGLLYIGYSCFT